MKLSKFKYFYPEAPFLVHRDQNLVSKLSSDPDFISEIKFNGQRLVLHVNDGTPEFWGRHGNKLTYKPSKDVLAAIKAKVPSKGYYVFDGELRHNKVIGIRNKIVLWDVFVWSNETATELEYCQRRELLKGLGLETSLESTLILIEQYSGNFKKIFDKLITITDEFEGLVIKNIHGQLELGRRSGVESQWMFKIRRKTNKHRF